MAFDFDSDSGRDVVFDTFPLSVQGHILNLRICNLDKSLDDRNFNQMQILVQIYGLSLDMYNLENARRIGKNV